ncbi:glycoside hydrolase family 5 protein [Xylariaceae sp. FL0662B]|nr:glycoside hydrolase family 5 protein [Xylariaceae sp. FL0662B]
MNLFLLFLGVTSVFASSRPPSDATLSPVTREGTSLMVDGKKWKAVGPNIYWLGLDENVVPPAGDPYYPPTKASYPTKERITEAIAMVKALGGTMIRGHTLGISIGNPLSVMPEPGVVNEAAFEPIDWAVYQAGQYGIRLLVPLVDNYKKRLGEGVAHAFVRKQDYYHGGKYDFLRWAGFDLTQARDSGNAQIQQFYTNASIVGAFKDYVATLLMHRNPHNGLTYAEDAAVFALETGNELLGPVWGDMDAPADWVRDIAAFLKDLAPEKLVVDGTYGVNPAHLAIDEVDIFSDHFYPVNTTKLRLDIEAVEAASKAFFAGEYDWKGQSGGDALESFFSVIEESPAACGDTFWSLFGHAAPDCDTFVDHNDGFALQYGNPENTAYINGRIQLIRKHFVAISEGREIAVNETLPVVPCPAPVLPIDR